MTTITKAAQDALEALDSLLDVAMVPMTCEGLCSADSAERWDDFSARRDALRAALQDKAVEVHLGPLVQRTIFDAIRGAYDLGYNDARNARSVPGDSAPGYKGRDVEADHGGALFNTLVRRLRNAAQPAPVVPDGFALVPVVATFDMRAAGNIELDRLKNTPGMLVADRAFYVWSAMIAASQQKGGQ